MEMESSVLSWDQCTLQTEIVENQIIEIVFSSLYVKRILRVDSFYDLISQKDTLSETFVFKASGLYKGNKVSLSIDQLPEDVAVRLVLRLHHLQAQKDTH